MVRSADAASRGLETRIAHGLRASVRAVDLAPAPNYEQPAAASTRTKRLERKRNKPMSLPDEDVGQVAALKYDRATRRRNASRNRT